MAEHLVIVGGGQAAAQAVQSLRQGSVLRDFRITSPTPCRLEFYDLDDTPSGGSLLHTGRLLAVDADGDGLFQSPGDFLSSDRNQNGQPDIAIAGLSRSLECHAWPLGDTGLSLSTSVATGSTWKLMSEDQITLSQDGE